MSQIFIAQLADRGAVSVTGADAEKFLNGLVTNELTHLQQCAAAHAGLLSAQGKILFEFLALRSADGFLLDVTRPKAADLAKRLTLYKLRAAVSIADVSQHFALHAAWGEAEAALKEIEGSMPFRDPRHPALGWRVATMGASAPGIALAIPAEQVPAHAYDAHRITLGVPEGGKDYDFGDAYPHEADFDLFNGVSFKKGCYVGQEIVARMQHKTVVRKRVVRVDANTDLASGADVTHNGVVFGRLGSVDGRRALVMLRLDRYVEAMTADDTVMAGDARISVHPDDLQRYLASVAAREKA